MGRHLGLEEIGNLRSGICPLCRSSRLSGGPANMGRDSGKMSMAMIYACARPGCGATFRLEVEPSVVGEIVSDPERSLP